MRKTLGDSSAKDENYYSKNCEEILNCDRSPFIALHFSPVIRHYAHQALDGQLPRRNAISGDEKWK
jgi:hypothetical protein